MADDHSKLDAIVDRAWSDLEKATGEPGHPYRLGELATVHPERGVAARTVVLRRVDRAGRRFWCFADRRSDKILEIEADPRIAWVSFDPMMRIQLRWSGRARVVVDGELVDASWAGMNDTQRDEYACAASPGTVLNEGWDRPETPPKRVAPQEARQWFCMIEILVERLDWLALNPVGHQRARFKWDSSGAMRSAWVAP